MAGDSGGVLIYLEHRSGTKHRKADGLSRQTCKDCRLFPSIEKRNGGSSRKESSQKQMLLPGWVPTSCLDGTLALDRARLTQGRVAYPGMSTGSSHETPSPTVAGLNLGAAGTPDGLPAPPGINGLKGEQARLQAKRQATASYARLFVHMTGWRAGGMDGPTGLH